MFIYFFSFHERISAHNISRNTKKFNSVGMEKERKVLKIGSLN